MTRIVEVILTIKIQKSNLEVILMIRTERYDVQKRDLEVVLMIRTGDTTYEKAT